MYRIVMKYALSIRNKSNIAGSKIAGSWVESHPSPMHPNSVCTSDETLQGRNMSRCSGAL